MKKILVACEYSQIVMTAFLEAGVDAYSCDIIPTSGPYPERHYQMVAIECSQIQKWDLIIAHPPCTYMSIAGARHMFKGGTLNETRLEKAMQAKSFFMYWYNWNKSPIAIENPIPLKIVGLPIETQRICISQFGIPYTKKICLWLKGIPPLIPNVDYVINTKQFVSTKHDGKGRSRFFPEVAKAMAEQWLPIL